jgi:hypothetical protein
MDKKKKIKKAFEMKRYLFLTLSIIILSLAGCDYFDNSDSLKSAVIEVNISGLPSIPDSMTFVAWFDQDLAGFDPIKVFAKDADQNGNLTYSSEKPLGNLLDAQIFLFTIERESAVNDSGFAPTNSRLIMSGRFKSGNCILDLGESVKQFSDISAVFSLATPTNGNSTSELSGVWFVDSLTTGGPKAGLKLPELFSSWRYEGWVEINGTLVSTGRFIDTEGADLFSEYSSTGNGYPFPGEDFLQNAPVGLTFPTNLSGQKVYISLERNDGLNSGVAPFAVLLSGNIPASAQDGVSYLMVKTNNSVPGGSAVIKVDLLE